LILPDSLQNQNPPQPLGIETGLIISLSVYSGNPVMATP